jgi:pilus assembly protein CpaB
MRTVALVVAILLGIAAAIGVYSFMKKQQAKVAGQYKPVLVAFAARHIDAGEALAPEMIELKPQPVEMLTPQHITKDDVPGNIGRIFTRNVDKGYPIFSLYFLPRERKPASGVVPEGYRAITLAVDATTGVAGLMKPGDNVDIFGTLTDRKGGTGQTWLVLSHVNILAVDDRTTDASMAPGDYRTLRRGYSNVTLSVTPAEAEVLIYLQENAKLTFALRPASEIGQKESLPPVDGANVIKMAEEANKERQKRVQEAGARGGRP